MGVTCFCRLPVRLGVYPVAPLYMGDFMEYTNTNITHIINEHIHSERDRRVLLRRYVDGVTIERLAEEFDMSVGGIKLILSRNKKIMLAEK